MPVMEKKISDKHWDSKIARKPFRTPNDVLAHLKECEYRVNARPISRIVHLTLHQYEIAKDHLQHRLQSKTRMMSCALGRGDIAPLVFHSVVASLC